MYPPSLWKSVVTLELAFVNFILICTLDSGNMKSPKLREIILLVFTCLCITKSVLICSLSKGIFNEVKKVLGLVFLVLFVSRPVLTAKCCHRMMSCLANYRPFVSSYLHKCLFG